MSLKRVKLVRSVRAIALLAAVFSYGCVGQADPIPQGETMGSTGAQRATVNGSDRRDKANAPPRKVVVATMVQTFPGTVDERLARASRLVDEAAADAAKQYGSPRLDLVVFPEHAILVDAKTAAEKAVPLKGKVLDTLGAKAKQHRVYLVVPMITAGDDGRVRNVAVLIDRDGKHAGTYAKYHPVAVDDGSLESGITPGNSFPVFDCDFGKLGIQICWDMSYDDGWQALSRQGAEIVVVPSASPQTVRPASFALRGQHYVVTSTPRNNATIFNPIGVPAAQRTTDGVLVHQIDLSFAILHWQTPLDNGRALTKLFGDKVGYDYTPREDTGVFWSNDSGMTIGQMIGQLKLRQMQVQVEEDEVTQTAARPK